MRLTNQLRRGTQEHYQDPRLYDFDYRRRREDVRFYERLARDAPGPVLELGCGSGRVTAALVRAGARVVGVDLSAPMLAAARDQVRPRRKGAPGAALLARGDMRDLPVRGPFPLVICPFNAFMHLYFLTEVEACLAEVRRVLAPGGQLVLDVLNPDLRWLLRDPERRWAKLRFRHPVDGLRYVYSTNHTYDAKHQIAHIKIYYDCLDDPARSVTVALAHRQFFPQELRALLAYNGFRVLAAYGDFAGRAFEEDSDSQVLVCVAR
jgi:SAM-dependent methyltransferase